jgi:hypothetical protein
MFDTLHIIGEIQGSLPYLYRIWFLIFSRKYRIKVAEEYKKHSTFYIGFDIFMSLIFFGLECWVLFMSVSYFTSGILQVRGEQ